MNSFINTIFLELILCSISFGIILINLIILVYLFINTKERILFSSILLFLFSLIFIITEILFIYLYYNKSLFYGKAVHRIQALSIMYLTISLNYFIYCYFLDKNIINKINKYLLIFAFIFSIFTTIISFLYPDLFISQNNSLIKNINFRWSELRGNPGILYYLRDILNFVLIAFSIFFILRELIYKKIQIEINLIFGLLFGVILSLFDYFVMYFLPKNTITEFVFIKNISHTIIGIIVFNFFFLLNIIRNYIDIKKYLEISKKFETIGFMISGLAHDCQNIFTIISTNVSFLINKYQNDNILVDYLKEIEKAIYRINDINREILDFVKTEGYKKQNVVLRDLIQDNINFFSRYYKNIEFIFNFDENIKEFYCYKSEINQLFQNIILNSIQSMDGKGKIFISVQKCYSSSEKVDLDKNFEYILITFKDEGKGINKRDIKKIFTLFFTTKQRGIGIGLSICYSIVRNHKGLIFVDTKEDEGAIIKIYLPIFK